MTCNGLDLTIEGALADPVIGAAMRADRVDPAGLETLLRAAARRLETTRRQPVVQFASLGDRFRRATCGTLASW